MSFLPSHPSIEHLFVFDGKQRSSSAIIVSMGDGTTLTGHPNRLTKGSPWPLTFDTEDDTPLSAMVRAWCECAATHSLELVRGQIHPNSQMAALTLETGIQKGDLPSLCIRNLAIGRYPYLEFDPSDGPWGSPLFRRDEFRYRFSKPVTGFTPSLG